MTTRIRILGCAVLVVAATALPAAAEWAEWAVHAGSFNMTKNPRTAEAGVELRFATRWPGVDAVVGAAGAADGNFWAYGGGRYTIDLDRRWDLSLGFAVSLYEDGDGKDLGGPIEFRTSYEISVATGKRSRLGLVLYHLSNAGFYDLNPGSNSLVLAWTERRRD